MAGLAKRYKRAVKRFSMAWRTGLIEHSPRWMRRIFGPAAIYLDMTLIDHGIFRFLYLNKHALAEDTWRSAQPAPHHLRQFKRDGLKTIVNLRGERMCGSYWLEEQWCRDLGLELVNFQVRSRAAPTPEEFRRAKALFERIEYPMLMHCKSGADRAGLMSVLYRHFREGMPIEMARDELSLRYGHIRQADTGILDFVFDRYVADNAEQPIAFMDWVETRYDPEEIADTFKSNGWANRFVGTVLQRE
ncbi:MAG: protein tyrosine phosphatase [Alphaproteobacteria bacterium BRH_c36]|nr:MAG: protein tyrosine phosphatase [Alphaproteobacteria bacterium BRH_c36]